MNLKYKLALHRFIPGLTKEQVLFLLRCPFENPVRLTKEEKKSVVVKQLVKMKLLTHRTQTRFTRCTTLGVETAVYYAMRGWLGEYLQENWKEVIPGQKEDVSRFLEVGSALGGLH